MSRLYPVAFCSTILGLIIYYINPEDNPIITQENDNEFVDNTNLNNASLKNDLENNISMEFIN
ncbi:31392_t:CDS:1 [Racocetra persica]|uniref:31392_t:CDS:1 n=1 Tax=Racocetra persica TaxID=160502 RepID=A0ACA9NN87_9GLOM|nr:31392_t:CDS:1 [Racocetra persica]